MTKLRRPNVYSCCSLPSISSLDVPHGTVTDWAACLSALPGLSARLTFRGKTTSRRKRAARQRESRPRASSG